MKIAFLFPGQAPNTWGWADLYEHYSLPRAVFKEAAEVLFGPELLEVIFKGPDEKLKQTEFAQPAV